MMTEFLKFLQTGRISNLKVGQSKLSVLGVSGTPLHWTDRSFGKTSDEAWAWYYPGLMLSFEDNRICTITVTLICQGEATEHPWMGAVVDRRMTIEEFGAMLQRNGIEAARLPKAIQKNLDAAYLTEGGVLVCARPLVVETGAERDSDLPEISAVEYIDTCIKSDLRRLFPKPKLGGTG